MAIIAVVWMDVVWPLHRATRWYAALHGRCIWHEADTLLWCSTVLTRSMPVSRRIELSIWMTWNMCFVWISRWSTPHTVILQIWWFLYAFGMMQRLERISWLFRTCLTVEWERFLISSRLFRLIISISTPSLPVSTRAVRLFRMLILCRATISDHIATATR